jgi:peptidoglycan/LPS O-acetylase OafA/YrhL
MPFSGSREPCLEGLRGLAALMVFLYHLRWNAGEPVLRFMGIDWQPVLKRFDIGVCLFFVLSGYLLSGPFWDAILKDARWPDVDRYAIRRLARILPAYWGVLIAVAVLSPSTYNLWGGISLLLQCTGLHTLADYCYNGAVPVFWTIAIELQFYALLPILFRLAAWGARGRKWAVPVALTLMIFALDIIWKVATGRMAGHLPSKILPDSQSRVVTASVFYYLKWFGGGMAAAYLARMQIIMKSPLFVWNVAFILGLLGFGLVIANAHEGEWRAVSAWGWPLGPGMCALIVIAAPRARISLPALDNWVMRFFGLISYGIYLWHWPLQKAVFGGTLPNRLGASGAFFVCGTLSTFVMIAVAGLSQAALERPAITWAARQSSLGGALRSLLAWTGLRSAAEPQDRITSNQIASLSTK